MKNYTIIVKIENYNIREANYYDSNNLNDLQKQFVEHLTTTLTRVNDLASVPITCNASYVFYENDDLAQTEAFMREIGFRKCDMCGAWIAPQDLPSSVYMGNNIRYCATCAGNLEFLEISSYHGSGRSFRYIQCSDETMTEDNFIGVGIEMEGIFKKRGAIRNGRLNVTPEFVRANKKGNAKYYHFRLEADNSLDSAGCEFISNCFSVKYAQNFDWSILTNCFKQLEADDDDRRSGFHVHLSKLMFGSDEKTQALNTLKLNYFVAMYQDDFFKMSGRKSRDEYTMRYCSFLSLDEIHAIMHDLLSRESDFFRAFPSSHSKAIINSNKTVEVRIFKSTSDPEKIKHVINFLTGLVKGICATKFEKCYCFSKVFRFIDNETLTYWRKKGLFMRTAANETKGVQLSA